MIKNNLSEDKTIFLIYESQIQGSQNFENTQRCLIHLFEEIFKNLKERVLFLASFIFEGPLYLSFPFLNYARQIIISILQKSFKRPQVRVAVFY